MKNGRGPSVCQCPLHLICLIMNCPFFIFIFSHAFKNKMFFVCQVTAHEAHPVEVLETIGKLPATP